jgi:hypothetical protein
LRQLDILVRYRGHTLELSIRADAIEVNGARCEIPSMKIGIRGTVHVMNPGERRTFGL